MWSLQVRNILRKEKIYTTVVSQISRKSSNSKLHPTRNFSLHTNIATLQTKERNKGLSGQNPKQIPLLQDTDMKAFMKEYPGVIQDLIYCSGLEFMVEWNNYLQEVAYCTVSHGNLLRPTLMLATAKLTQEKTGFVLPNLNRIAWAYEFLQGFATVLDDVKDGSAARRDRSSWYLVSNLEEAAINDLILLESSANVLLKQNIIDHYALSVYSQIVNTINECILKNYHGQSLDDQMFTEKQYGRFTMEMYKNMMTFENGYYTFYVPIVMGLLLNQVHDEDIFRKIEKISLDLDFIYSVQDEFIDCFGDPAKSGKAGTDIQDGKPTWLLIQALSNANQRQRKFLLNNYGQKADPAKFMAVKEIYTELGLPEVYSNYEKNEIENILFQIESLPEIVPKEPLQQLVKALNGHNR